IEGLLDKEHHINDVAARAVGWIAPRVKDAIPRLLQALEQDSPRRANLGKGLSQLGKEVVPHLLRILRDGSPDQRGAAIMAFLLMDSPPKEAIPGLIGGFTHKDAMVRAHARSALSKFKETSVPPLVEALKDPSEVVRWEAVTALGELREGAKSAFPSIIE